VIKWKPIECQKRWPVNAIFMQPAALLGVNMRLGGLEGPAQRPHAAPGGHGGWPVLISALQRTGTQLQHSSGTPAAFGTPAARALRHITSRPPTHAHHAGLRHLPGAAHAPAACPPRCCGAPRPLGGQAPAASGGGATLCSTPEGAAAAGLASRCCCSSLHCYPAVHASCTV
jgi:hypothetical protein